jgi:protein ImuA
MPSSLTLSHRSSNVPMSGAGIPWPARRSPACPPVLPSSTSELPGGGWPRGGLTELLPVCRGVGELSLLLPALARLSSDELAWLVCVALAPSALCARAAGREESICRVCWWPVLRVVMPPGLANARSLPTVSAPSSPGCPKPRLPSLRRLQLAAEASRTLLFVFRSAACASQSSPAPLRLALEGEGEQLIVRLLKRRGGAQPVPLPIAIQRPVRLSHALACPASAPPAAGSFSQPANACRDRQP